MIILEGIVNRILSIVCISLDVIHETYFLILVNEIMASMLVHVGALKIDAQPIHY